MALAAKSVRPAVATRQFLHVGCGPVETCPWLPKAFKSPEWKEIRLDIDERVNPDVVASMTDMPNVATASVDAIFSSHNIEHLMFHEVRQALSEFYRVLSPGGFVLLTCPDLQSVAELIAKGNLFGPAYQSAAGPISAFDMVYGYTAFTRNNPFMMHKSGFTLNSLLELFGMAGFKMPIGKRNPELYDMWVLAYKEQQDVEAAKQNFATLLQS